MCVLTLYISDEHSGAQINGTSHAPIHISNYHVRGLCTRLFVRTRFVYFEHVFSLLSTYSIFNRFLLKLDKRILVSEIRNVMCCAQFIEFTINNLIATGAKSEVNCGIY